jgi:hypothetical protein
LQERLAGGKIRGVQFKTYHPVSGSQQPGHDRGRSGLLKSAGPAPVMRGANLKVTPQHGGEIAA